MFPLCRTCAETTSQETCKHDEEGGAITGTWVTDEVKTVIRKGYTLLNIYEVWHFENVSQYNTETKMGAVFTEYVNTFLKMKQEASGWPKWCQTEEEKNKYTIDCYTHDGVLLDRNSIEENPGLRRLAKLMLNRYVLLRDCLMYTRPIIKKTIVSCSFISDKNFKITHLF